VQSDGVVFRLDLAVSVAGEEKMLASAPFEVFKENKLWRVSPPEEMINMMTRMPQY